MEANLANAGTRHNRPKRSPSEQEASRDRDCILSLVGGGGERTGALVGALRACHLGRPSLPTCHVLAGMVLAWCWHGAGQVLSPALSRMGQLPQATRRD